MSAGDNAAATAATWGEMEETFARSPIHQGLGLTLEIIEAGKVRIHYDGNRSAANRRGNAAGGAIAQMVDSAIVQACKTMIGPHDTVATLELKVNFLRPGPPNAGLITTGGIEHLGRATCVGVGRVHTQDGRLVALGTGTVSVRRREHE